MTILDEYAAFQDIDPEATPVEFVAGEVFGLTTYDEEQDGILVGEILEVFKVIRNGQNLDYIAAPGNLTKYTRAINLGNCIDWLDWGTSVRGAWLKPEMVQRFDEVVRLLESGATQSTPPQE